MTLSPRDWWDGIRKHPYLDSVVLLIILTCGMGGVRVLRGPAVLLSVDGAKHKVYSKAINIGNLLTEQKITLGPIDFVTPSSTTVITRNMNIQVTRVTVNTEVQFERNKPRMYWRVQLKPNLRPVTVERGFVQESSRTVKVTYYDGVKTSEQVIKTKRVRKPVFYLTLFNRKTNQPEKVYDLAKAKRMEMRATGYYVGEKYVPSDVTFLGYKLRRGLVAVDPKVIPLRTRLYVKGYGYAYAADTGSAIKGNRIDLAVKDKKEEAAFNRKKITVYILEKAKSW